MGHHVPVPPSGERAGLFPGLGLGELDGPAEPLSLRVRDPQQRGAVQAHGAESYSTKHARPAISGSRAGRDRLNGRDRSVLEAASALGIEPGSGGSGRDQDRGGRRAAIGCDVAQIVKSLVFMADDSQCSRSPRARTAWTRPARRHGRRRRRRRATPEEARVATGFAVGGTPPFGHPTPCAPGWTRIPGVEGVWAAGGTPDAVFPLTPADLQRARERSSGFVER